MKIYWLGIFIVFYGNAHAAMVGYSHNDTTNAGRARANIIYNNTTKVTAAIHAETTQPTMDTEPNIVIPEPVHVPEIVPEPEPDLTADIALATEYLSRLQDEIKQLDSEIARCKSAKRNWTIGTVVGGVGVVGTATGAIVQAVQINKAKKNGATESSDTDTETESDTEQK